VFLLLATTEGAGFVLRGLNRPPYTDLPPSGPYASGYVDSSVKDATRGRKIAYRLSYPRGFTGAAPIIIISHGGDGETVGYKSLPYLRREYASWGYIVININHLPSKDPKNPSKRNNLIRHLQDRPQDVSFLVTQLLQGNIRPPVEFTGTMDPAHIGHVGDSVGANTCLSLGGAVFDYGTYADSRITAFCPISPQGRGTYGSFDRGPGDNSWMTVVAPAYVFVGSGEIDGDCDPEDFVEAGWRLQPFEGFPEIETKYLSIVPDACHYVLAGYGTVEQLGYIAQNSRVFFDFLLKGDAAAEGMIGQTAWISGAIFEVKSTGP